MMMFVMKYESIEDFIKAIKSAFPAQGRKSLSEWKAGHRESLRALESIHLHFLEEVDALSQGDVSSKKLPSLLESVLQEQIDWLESFHATTQNASPSQLIGQWRRVFSELTASSCPQKISPDATEEQSENEMEGFLRLHLEYPLSKALLNLSRPLCYETAQIFHQLHQDGELWIEQCLDALTVNAEKDHSALTTPFRPLSPSLEAYFAKLDLIEKERAETLEADGLSVLERAMSLGNEVKAENRPEIVSKSSHFGEDVVRLDAEAAKLQEGWDRHFEAEQDDWKKDLELALLLVRVSQAHIQSQQLIQARISGELVPKFQEARDLITLSLKKFKETEKAVEESSDLKSMILSESRSMLRTLRRETLPEISSLLDQVPLLKNLENCHSRIFHAVDQLSETHWLLVKADWDSPFPNPKVSEVQLKALVKEEACQQLETEHEDLLQQVQSAWLQITQNVSEFDALVEYNLESGLDLLARPEGFQDAPIVRREIIEGLERALSQIETMTMGAQGIAALIQENRQKGIESFQQQIRALGQNEKILELKVRLAKAKTVEQARTYQEKLLDRGEETLSSARSILLKQWDTLKLFYSRMRGFAGLPASRVEGEDGLSKFVLENRKKFEELPYVYQRLFQLNPLADQRFFEGQDRHLAGLKTSFEAWRNGSPGITVIVGEKGCGRTSLINAAAPKIYNQLPFFRISLALERPVSEEALLNVLNDVFKISNVSNLDELESQILIEKDRKIICLEDLQNLFLRTVDGFDLLERLLMLMSRTCETIYWLNTCTLYSWRYLEKALDISTFFQSSHFLNRLTREEIESIILKRHRVSGYGLVFDAPVIRSKQKKQSNNLDPQAVLRTAFFNRLTTLADGNISVALLFWLTAIQKIENHTLTISSDLNVDSSSLFRISSDELFTLAALLHHERLNVGEHVWVFRLEKKQSLILLDRMEKKGIVVQTATAHYQINPILYRPIVHALKLRNILH